MAAKKPHTFSNRAIKMIRKIPKGQVATYGMIAALCGNPKMARQVSYVLHSFSKKENLPWHRVINRFGKISLHRLDGYELQKSLLEAEGIVFDSKDTIDLKEYLWQPEGHMN